MISRDELAKVFDLAEAYVLHMLQSGGRPLLTVSEIHQQRDAALAAIQPAPLVGDDAEIVYELEHATDQNAMPDDKREARCLALADRFRASAPSRARLVELENAAREVADILHLVDLSCECRSNKQNEQVNVWSEGLATRLRAALGEKV